MENDVILQPYGKDEFYVNLIATDEGDWFFGPSDVSSFKNIADQALAHSYIKIKGINPKYHKFPIDKNFKLKEEDKELFPGDSKKPKNVNELYVFIIYNSIQGFVHMNYTPDYEEYNDLKKNFNLIGSFLIVGDKISVTKEKIDVGIGAPKDIVIEAIEDMKNESEE